MPELRTPDNDSSCSSGWVDPKQGHAGVRSADQPKGKADEESITGSTISCSHESVGEDGEDDMFLGATAFADQCLSWHEDFPTCAPTFSPTTSVCNGARRADS